MLFGILGNAFKRFKSFELFPRTWPLVKQACPSLNKTDQTLSFVFRSRPLKIILIFTSRNKSIITLETTSSLREINTFFRLAESF